MTNQAILEQALRLRTAAERAAYLDKACAGDPERRQQIEALLLDLDAPGGLAQGPAGRPRSFQSPACTQDAAGGSSVLDGGPGAETRAAGEGEGDDAASLYFLAPASRPGTLGRMGHYDVLELLGKGGMGLVLKAFDTRLERIVAIKVMAPALAVDATARKRFVREAQAGAAVNHRNVVTIYAVEAQHNPPYLVMELVVGRSLAEKVQQEGPHDMKEVVRIGSEIASGLAAAHARGLIHRDIKPANVLLEDATGRVKITDFGLARAANEARLTQSGLVSGTPQYMSPEQALGQHLDARSDLFSLGGVLYFLCTARSPFRAANTFAVLNKVIKDEPPSLRELRPGVPSWLCDLVARLQAKDPAQRPQSAEEVAEALARHLTDDPAQAITNQTLPTGKGEWGLATVDWVSAGRSPNAGVGARRRRLTIWLACSTAILALAIAFVFAFANRGEKPGPGDAEGTRIVTAFQPFSLAGLAGPDTFRLAPLKRLRQGVACNVGCIPRGFSPDGKWLLTVSDGDPVVRVWDVATGRQHRELPCTGDITRGPTFSHNGVWLSVYGLDGLVQLWDTRTFAPALTLERQPVRIRSAAFDSEDRVLATGRHDGKVQFWEVATGRKLAELAGAAAPVLGLDFLPGNKRLAVFSIDRPPRWNIKDNIWYYDCLVRALDIEQKAPTFGRALCEWAAPDTQFILFSVTGDRICFLKNRYQRGPRVALADAGTGTIREIEVQTRPASVPFTAVPVPGGGLLVGHSDRVARLWNMEAGEVRWQAPLPSHEDYGCFALHPDGQTAAFGADDLTGVHFFDLKAGQELVPRH